MFAIIGAVIGFFQALVPDVIKLTQDKRDKAHELEMVKLQIQAQKDGATSHLEEIRTTSQAAESDALQKSYRSELKYSGKYSAGVRPTITYMAMGLYLLQKILLVYAIIFMPTLPWLVGTDTKMAQVAVVVWTSFDETLMSWIIGFWFGSRQVKKD